jgi:hypothetical protein
MVLSVIEFYRTLLWSPAPVFGIWTFLREALALLIPSVLICWLAAIVSSRAFIDRKEELTTFVRARMGWAWASLLGMLVLLIHVVLLSYYERVVAISAALPYYAVACCLALIAATRVIGLRRELKQWQNIVS